MRRREAAALTVFVLIMALVLVPGCGGGGGGGGGGDYTAADINGTWDTGCVDQGATSMRRFIIFSDPGFDDTTIFYTQADDCTAFETTSNRLGLFSVGDSFTCDSGPACAELDLDYNTDPDDYNIFNVDGGTMFLGDYATGDGSSPANRPTDIFDSMAFIEQ
jgi:hypothetical protein